MYMCMREIERKDGMEKKKTTLNGVRRRKKLTENVTLKKLTMEKWIFD